MLLIYLLYIIKVMAYLLYLFAVLEINLLNQRLCGGAQPTELVVHRRSVLGGGVPHKVQGGPHMQKCVGHIGHHLYVIP